MGKILFLIVILILLGIRWAFPLWIVVNFVCWVFHLSFHLTLIQAFALCLLATVVSSLFKSKEEK